MLFFERVSALIEVATGHNKYAVNRAGDHLRSTLCFSGFLGGGGLVLPSLEVATAPCKNAGIRAGDPLRSTL